MLMFAYETKVAETSMIPKPTTIRLGSWNHTLTRILVRAVSVLSVVLFLGSAFRTKAVVITATSASQSAVQAAVNSAATGDTVQVPAGAATWTTSVTVNKDIILKGAGIGQTVITDGGGANSINLITFNTSTNFPGRLTGFTFNGLPGQVNSYSGGGEINVHGTSWMFRADHNQFNWLGRMNVHVLIPAGVFDHNQFNLNWQDGIECWGQAYGGTNADVLGDGSWSSPMDWGTTNAIYMENNIFVYTNGTGYPGPGVNDSSGGARIVFRYNIATNCFFQHHGTESTQMRSGRASEIYENLFVNTVAGQGCVFETRGGSGVMWSNTVIGYYTLIRCEDFRSLAFFAPFGSANGQNGWDSNNPTAIVTGTVTGAPAAGLKYLTDTSQSWAANQFVPGYTLQVRSGTNTGDYVLIGSNSANVIYPRSTYNGTQLLFTNGMTYKVYQSYRHIDQVGSGSGDAVYLSGNTPLNRTTGKPTWVHQSPEPLYQWGNNLNGVLNSTTSTTYFDPATGAGGYSIVQVGRDLLDNVAKPGYTPLIYPHPLVSGTAPPTYALTVVNGSGGGSYPAGTIVTIYAGTISGKHFTNWSGSNIANTSAATTTVTMPAASLTVTANFAANPSTYPLTVINGSGSGSYATGTVVGISAITIPNEIFDSWSGFNIANTNSANTSVTMPAAGLTVTAIYIPSPPSSLKIMAGP